MLKHDILKGTVETMVALTLRGRAHHEPERRGLITFARWDRMSISAESYSGVVDGDDADTKRTVSKPHQYRIKGILLCWYLH
jgi:hypothetical protein